LLGRPDVAWGGLCKEISPVRGFRPFNGLEVAKFGLSCYSVGVGGPELLGPAGGFRKVLPVGGQSGVHEALDFGEGSKRGAVASIVVVSAERAEENSWSSWLWVGTSGGKD